MWGLANRAVRLQPSRRTRDIRIGGTRVSIRGPVEHTIVELAGELDFTNVQDVVRAVDSLDAMVAAFDIAQLEFVDIDGVRGIGAMRASIEARTGVAPRLEGGRSAVLRTIKLVEQHAARVLRH